MRGEFLPNELVLHALCGIDIALMKRFDIHVLDSHKSFIAVFLLVCSTIYQVG